MNYKWTLKSSENEDNISDLSEKLNIPSVLAKILTLRGIKDIDAANKFFNPNMEDLLDPFLMDDMDKAVDRIIKGIYNKEQFWIYGDYDVDGTLSVSLITLFLREIGGKVDYFIPDRFQDNFSNNFNQSIDEATKKGATILITVDVGIASFELINLANKNNLNVIICDHHEPAETLPNALAILDPLKDTCNYPFKSLAACGVAFKLIQAISIKLGNPKIIQKYLDFVAISSVADMVPLNYENRIMLYNGLNKINTNPRPGLKNLIYCSGLKQGNINTSNIIYSISPLINAAGRLGQANRVVEMMTNLDEIKSFQIAQQLEDENRKRRVFDQKLYDDALPIAKKQKDSGKHSIVIYGEGWHLGVIGIVTSKLVEKFHSPVVVLSNHGKYAKGSARSMHNFDIYIALKECDNLLADFGGHKHAAGITIALNKIEKFKDKFEEIVRTKLTGNATIPEIQVDAEINLENLSNDFFKIVNKFAPFGFDNPKPIFLTKKVKTTNGLKQIGTNRFKFKVSQENFTIDAMAYNLNHKLDILQSGKYFSIVYNLEPYIFNKQQIPQIVIKDIKIE